MKKYPTLCIRFTPLLQHRVKESALARKVSQAQVIRDALNVINATTIPIINNRGASRRQNILGNAGRVTSVLEVGPSTIYFIQLGNNTRVASIVKQPGNGHYLITAQSAYQLESPSQLLTVLQQRNLAEIHQYLVNEYMERNPEHLNEFKELLRKHINEKKK